MVETTVFDGLQIKKPLQKMHEKELRELAVKAFPMITSASAMNKEELLSAICDVSGMALCTGNQTGHFSASEKDTGNEAKKQMVQVKEELAHTTAPALRERLKRRLKQLKKLSRRASGSA